MTEQLALDLKEHGMRLAETAEGVQNNDWISRADTAIRVFAARGVPFSAEDIRQYAGDPLHPNALGARFNAAVRRGLIAPAGTTTATRPDRHASLLRLWIGRWVRDGEEAVGFLYP